jgi:DNA-directed RNA polymerase subunit RPC12/RpoP
MSNDNNGICESNVKFPKWDILPPFQFINPRIRTAPPKEETIILSTTTPKEQTIKSTIIDVSLQPHTIENPQQEDSVKCDACGTMNSQDAIKCSKCGFELQEYDVATVKMFPEKIKCPYCSENLMLEESERQSGKLTCPACGKQIELSR